MNPDLTMLSDSAAVDAIGRVYVDVDGEGSWKPLADYATTEPLAAPLLTPEEKATLKKERELDKQLRDLFAGGLVNENDKVQIRVLDGRLVWIRSDLMEQKWQEITPELAKEVSKTATEMKLPVEEAKKIEVQEPEAYEIGWYQDSKGDLYQFDGETWLGNVPDKKQIKTLEFLG